MNFELRHFNTMLITFSLDREGLDGLRCNIISVAENYNYLLPIGMESTGDSLLSWLKTRVVPKNREYVDKLLSQMGLSQRDTLGIIQISLGLSLNDSYWVVPENFEGKFEDYNLYDNDFVAALSLVAYTGYGSVKAAGFTSSPEFTTNGMLRKGWRRINGEVLLYKGGTEGARNTGKEPYSEFYAAQLAETMGLGYVKYDLAKWKYSICSVCPLFTSKDVSYVPIWRFGRFNGISDIIKFLSGLGTDYVDKFIDMMVFDALISNTDRHQGNFGLLVDSKTNKPLSFAPIFDNGLGLFPYAMSDDLEDIDKYADTRYSAFDVKFDDIVKELITDRQKAQLRKAINFKFKRNEKGHGYNLPAERLRIIEKHLQRKITHYLSF